MLEPLHFIDAFEFLSALRRSNPRWLLEDHWHVAWIFRGESSDQWTLLPSAWRDCAKNHPVFESVRDGNWDELVERTIEDPQHHGFNLREKAAQVRELILQTQFEYNVANAFVGIVDELGLTLPGGRLAPAPSLALFQLYEQESPFHPTIALAQHHGMPTRLLDWTHNPLIAAYFAAERARHSEGENIVVWALNRSALISGACREYTVLRSQIGYLHAQEGLFTYFQDANFRYLQTGAWPSLCEMIPGSDLIRLTLAKSAVPELLRLLWVERVSRAHVMPSLDSVTKALESTWDVVWPRRSE